MSDIESSSDNVAFEGSDKFLEAIAQPSDSKPTMQKVKTFKNRIFSLLNLFVDKSTTLTPIL